MSDLWGWLLLGSAVWALAMTLWARGRALRTTPRRRDAGLSLTVRNGCLNTGRRPEETT